MKKNPGSILIDMLLALSLSLFLAGVFSNIVSLYSKIQFNSYSLQNRLGLVQLQYYLMLAYQFQVDGEELRYMIADQEYTLRLSNGRLIQQPGTLIFLLDIEDCEFSLEEEEIILTYTFHNFSITRKIAYG